MTALAVVGLTLKNKKAVATHTHRKTTKSKSSFILASMRIGGEEAALNISLKKVHSIFLVGDSGDQLIHMALLGRASTLGSLFFRE